MDQTRYLPIDLLLKVRPCAIKPKKSGSFYTEFLTRNCDSFFDDRQYRKVIFARSNHVGAPERQRHCAAGANILNFSTRYCPELPLASDRADAYLGNQRIANVLQDAVARSLQPEAFAYPPCNLLGVDRTFGFDDGKRETPDSALVRSRRLRPHGTTREHSLYSVPMFTQSSAPSSGASTSSGMAGSDIASSSASSRS
jgi:hypothetical protein